MVGGDGVAEDSKAAGGADLLNRSRGCGHVVEVRGLADVGGVELPAVGFAGRDGEVLPVLVAIGHSTVLVAEHVAGDGGQYCVLYFLLRGPEVAQVDGRAVLVAAERFGFEVVMDGSGERVGDHQRRAHEVVGADFGGNAAFEVAVSAEHGDGDEAVRLDRVGDVGGQRAGVADAGGAAVADHLKTKRVEVGHESGLDVVVGDDAGAGGERGFNPRRRAQALFDGLLREQAGGHHDVGVRGVGAGGDRRDDYRAVVEVGLGVDAEAGFDAGGRGLDREVVGKSGDRNHVGNGHVGCGAGRGRTERTGDVAEQRRVPALTLPPHHLARGCLVALYAEQAGKLLVEARGGLREQHAILRAARAGDRGLDGREIERKGCGVNGFRGFWRVKEALRAHVGFDQLDLAVGASGEAEVVESFVVDREDAAGGAVLGGHVGDGGAVGERELGDAGTEELDELADDAQFAESFGDGENQVGGGGAFAELAGEAEADDFGHQHGDRLAEHGGLGLDAADAPAEDAEPVDHGGMGVGADEGVGIRDDGSVGLVAATGRGGEDDAGEVFEVDLVADAHAGGDGGEVAEGGLAPLEEGVALAVALELERGVHVVGVGGAELVDLDGVVDDELGGLERVDLFGVAAQRPHGIAHRREIDDGGDAGEVLHEHPGGHVGDLAGGRRLRVPAGQEANVIRTNRSAVFAAEQVFEQDAQRPGEPVEIDGGIGLLEVLCERGEGEVRDGLAAGGEGGSGLEGVGMRGAHGGVFLGRRGARAGEYVC